RDLVLKEWKRLWEAAEVAKRKLLDQVDDAEAHLSLGQYQCFVRGDWATGMLHLVRGGDPALRQAAEKDLAAPTEASERATLAELWWQLGEKAPVAVKMATMDRAELWYRRAFSGLTGSAATKTQQRLQKIDETRQAASILFAKRHPADATAFGDHWYKVI